MNALAIREADFQATIVETACTFGWLIYHTHDSRRSAPGFPDLVMVRPPRLVFVELKTERGRVMDEQRAWLDALAGCDGVETYVWRPADWDTAVEVLR